MKRIILVRHAKSGWDNPNLSDFERPLNKKGHKQAEFMSKLFVSKEIKPDLIVSSDALRAITTANYFAKQLGVSFNDIQQENAIYERGFKFIINFAKELDNEIETIMIFGHNPDITSLASYYCGEYFDSMPTCSIICIDFNSGSWSDTDSKNGKINFIEYAEKYIS